MKKDTPLIYLICLSFISFKVMFDYRVCSVAYMECKLREVKREESIMNQFLVVIKCSTFVSIIAVPDLLFQALRLSAIWIEPIGILSVTALIYIILITTISVSFKFYIDRATLRYK